MHGKEGYVVVAVRMNNIFAVFLLPLQFSSDIVSYISRLHLDINVFEQNPDLWNTVQYGGNLQHMFGCFKNSITHATVR